MKNNNITRISLWSGPRNISTALMYSFAQRKDTKVFDEPLYAHYLKNSNAKNYHPGSEDILEAMENDGEKVIKNMLSCSKKPVLFFKNMTHHLLDLDYGFMKSLKHVILTRHPEDMLPSYAKVIQNPTLNDVGYKQHIELMTYFDENNLEYVVLDSKHVLMNPEGVLRKLCKEINIPFDGNMLKWEPQQLKEDGIWAKYWYDNVHKSSGFSVYKPKTDAFPERLKPLLRECLPYYNQLLTKALT